MNIEHPLEVINNPIKLAVIFDQLLVNGGGYHQALNDVVSINEHNNQHTFIPIFFTMYKENINLLQEYGVDAHLINISKFGRLVIKLRSKVFSAFILNVIQRFFRFNRFEKALVDKKIDLVYFISPTYWTRYLEKLNYITTIWDLCHRDFQEFPEVRENRNFEVREINFTKNLTKAIAIITDSELGKDNIIKRYLVDGNRVYVAPFSPSILFKENIQISQKDVQETKNKYGLSEPYIYYPAQFWAHKNHIYILEGLVVLREKYNIILHAVFSGGDAGNLDYIKNIVLKLDLSDQVNFIGFAPNKDIPILYSAAVALVMPTYFGPTNIPPLEAFRVGLPVLYSNLPGLKEQVEGAALLLDLKNPGSMATHLSNLISDEKLREELILAGKKIVDKRSSISHGSIIESICFDFKIKKKSWGAY
ncbi:glycosyltransferase family 4 protein [Candidatus Thioglobus sp.]|nr:glycosyltransferase family 4 protein [Candidatus Thioglobus sp.]